VIRTVSVEIIHLYVTGDKNSETEQWKQREVEHEGSRESGIRGADKKAGTVTFGLRAAEEKWKGDGGGSKDPQRKSKMLNYMQILNREIGNRIDT